VKKDLSGKTLEVRWHRKKPKGLGSKVRHKKKTKTVWARKKKGNVEKIYSGLQAGKGTTKQGVPFMGSPGELGPWQTKWGKKGKTCTGGFAHRLKLWPKKTEGRGL